MRVRVELVLLSIFFFLFLFNHSVWPSILLVDNFDGKEITKNSLGGGVFWFTSHKELATKISLATNVTRKNRGKCLQIDYNLELRHKPHTIVPVMSSGRQTDLWISMLDYYNRYPTFFVYLSEVKREKNFKKYDYLVLYIKGDSKHGYTRSLNIELKDKKFTSVYTIDGITDNWQKFLIPLKSFSGINLSCVVYVGICLNSDVVTTKTGRIYVDDIYLTKALNVEHKKLYIKLLREPIVIDGEVSDWKKAKWIQLSNRKNLEFGEISSEQDLTVKFAAYYERQWLFIAVDVVDDDVCNRQAESNIWQEDCVELYFDPENNGLVWGDVRDYQIGFSPVAVEEKLQKWSWFQQEEPADAYVYAKSRLHKKGYTMEIAINWQYLNLSISEVKKFGFNIAVKDFDFKDGSSAKLNYCWVKDVDEENIILATCILR